VQQKEKRVNESSDNSNGGYYLLVLLYLRIISLEAKHRIALNEQVSALIPAT